MNYIKKLLKKTFIYTLYCMIIRCYLGFYDKKMVKYIQQNGLRDLFLLQSKLEEKKLNFFFDFGTLLGIYRDSGIIKGDMDIDIGVIVKDDDDIFLIEKQLSDFKVIRRFLTESGKVAELSFAFNKYLRFDIHYYYKQGTKLYCYLFYQLPNKEYKENFFDAVKILVNDFSIGNYVLDGHTLNVPNDTQRFLAEKYGVDWNIPNSDWVYWEGPSSVKIDEQGYLDLFIR